MTTFIAREDFFAHWRPRLGYLLWCRRGGIGALSCMVVGALALTVARADAAPVLSNGSFETGDFFGWVPIEENSEGSFGLWEVVEADEHLFSGADAPEPADGSWQAVTEQSGSGVYALFQSFIVPEGGVLSFDHFWFNFDQAWFNPGHLEFDGDANQHARVDLITPDSAPFSTLDDDVLLNIFTVDSGPFEVDYNSITADISDLAGQEVRLRFAQVDNQYFFHYGVDNVRVVPEPAAVALIGLGSTACVVRRRR